MKCYFRISGSYADEFLRTQLGKEEEKIDMNDSFGHRIRWSTYLNVPIQENPMQVGVLGICPFGDNYAKKSFDYIVLLEVEDVEPEVGILLADALHYKLMSVSECMEYMYSERFVATND